MYSAYGDGCDRCGHTALFAVERDGKMLLFCGHHYRENEAALIAGRWQRVPLALQSA